jgi:hypothetical protein
VNRTLRIATVDVAFDRRARLPRARFDIHWRVEHFLVGCGFCHNFETRAAGNLIGVAVGFSRASWRRVLQPVACKLIDFT